MYATFHEIDTENGPLFYGAAEANHYAEWTDYYTNVDDLFNDYQAGRVEWNEGF